MLKKIASWQKNISVKKTDAIFGYVDDFNSIKRKKSLHNL